ncbi:hypothetical protein ES703_101227 [subsurface metagenome]
MGVNVYRLAIPAQDTGANGMKGADGQTVQRAMGQTVQPLLHFPSSFVGEGDCHNAAGTDPTDTDKVSDAVSDDPGLAAARTG